MSKQDNDETTRDLAVDSVSTGSDALPFCHSLERMVGDLAACAVERALSGDWEKHPMFGILSDESTDKWAIAYKGKYFELLRSRKEVEDFYFQNERINHD